MKRYELTQEAIDYVCNHTDRFRDKKRTREICEMRMGGVNLAEIGREFGITAGRVREICERVCRIYAYDEKVGKVSAKVDLTLYERIKAMPFEEMVSFFVYLNERSIIERADSVICRRCKSEHRNYCPIGDDDKCLYDMNDKDTIKLWLGGKAYE